MRDDIDELGDERSALTAGSLSDSNHGVIGANSIVRDRYLRVYTRYVMGMVLLVMIFNNIDRTILSILVRPIKSEFNLSDTQMGWLLGPAFAIVYSILALPFGRWADTTGVRRSIVSACLVVWSGFTVGTAFVSSYAQLFVVRMGVGVGEAGATAPSVSMLSDYLSPPRRARGMLVVSMGAVVGMGLGMVVGGWVEQGYGWRAAFLVAGVPGVLLALLFRVTIREPERGANEGLSKSAKLPFWTSLKFLLRSRTYQFILVANGFSLLAARGRDLWEPSFLIRTYGMNEFAAGSWYFLTSPLPSVLGIFMGGYLADRLGEWDRRWYMWVPALGQFASVPILAAFLLWPVDDTLSLPGSMALFGVSQVPFGFVLGFFGSILGSFFAAPLTATVQGVSPLRMRAFAAAISTLVSTLVGLAAGPLLVGVLADRSAVEFGRDAPRYSLLVPTFVPILSGLVCLVGASHVGRDLVQARSVGSTTEA